MAGYAALESAAALPLRRETRQKGEIATVMPAFNCEGMDGGCARGEAGFVHVCHSGIGAAKRRRVQKRGYVWLVAYSDITPFSGLLPVWRSSAPNRIFVSMHPGHLRLFAAYNNMKTSVLNADNGELLAVRRSL